MCFFHISLGGKHTKNSKYSVPCACNKKGPSMAFLQQMEKKKSSCEFLKPLVVISLSAKPFSCKRESKLFSAPTTTSVCTKVPKEGQFFWPKK